MSAVAALVRQATQAGHRCNMRVVLAAAEPGGQLLQRRRHQQQPQIRLLSAGSTRTEELAKELSALANKPRQEFLAGLASVTDVRALAMPPVPNVPAGGRAWVLTPRGCDGSSVPLASLKATPDGTLFGAVTHAVLPMTAAVPLLDAALDESRERFALAGLPGLCEWAAKTLAEESVSLKTKFGEVAFEAAEAVALGRPRAGHSVLGQGTFRDAQPVWGHLAERFGGSEHAEEAALYRAAGAADEGVAYMADVSAEGIKASGGSLLLLSFKSQSEAASA